MIFKILLVIAAWLFGLRYHRPQKPWNHPYVKYRKRRDRRT